MSVAESPATVICVLGMSRSGTSLTTHVLSLAGVYLGPEDELLGGDLHQLAGQGERVLAKARQSNPGGHWEHYRLMRLNERILRSFGGSWREPPALPPGWESSELLADEREEARALLAQFEGHPLWGWKDPRNSLTLPFWQRLVPDLRCVVCLRNPLDVATSLLRRDGMPVEQGLELWRTYVTEALAATAGRRRLLVRYDSFFSDQAKTAARLAAFVGRDGVFGRDEEKRRLADAVDERLWRNRASQGSGALGDRFPDEVAALYELAEQLAADEAGDGS